MPSISPAFLVADQSLRGFEGHHYEYSKAVIEAAAAAGFAPLLAPHRNFFSETLAGAPVVGRFATGWNDADATAGRRAARKALAMLPAAWRTALIAAAAPVLSSATPKERSADTGFAEDLLKIMTAVRLDETSHTLIHTLGEAEFLGLAEVLPGRPALPGTLHVVLRYDGRESFTPAFQKLQGAVSDIRYWTDTEALAEQYRQLGAPRVGVLPIPHGFSEALREVARPHAPLTISYLGGARGDKGFDRLPALIAALSGALQAGRVRFLIQATFGVSREEPLMAKTTAALKRMPRAWVELIEQPPDADAFRRALEATDLLLLPYRADVYRRRSSGLLVQAMALGIPAVVPEETWLARYAPPGTCMTFGAEKPLEDAVREAIESSALFRRSAETAAREFDRHSGRRLVATMTASG
jgi:hypothetical protein